MAKKEKPAILPFVGNVTESIDLARRMWGLTGLPTLPTASGVAQFAQKLPQALPSMIAPTLDVDELDRRIADLRAVEQWLDLNMSMLRTTIQSLEVQRNTIATLKSFGGAMLSASAAAAATPAAPASVDPGAAAALQAAAARQRSAELAAAAAAAAAAQQESQEPPSSAPKAEEADALPLNPVAWWSTLQQQFGKIAASAAAEVQAAARRNAEREQTARRAAKTGARAKPRKLEPAPSAKPGSTKARPRRRSRPSAAEE